MKAWLWLIASALSLAGCAVNTSIVRQEAAEQLDCPLEQVEVRFEDDLFYVSGCELEATYVCARGKHTPTRCRPIGLIGVPLAKREPIVRVKAAALLDCDPAALDVSGGLGGRYIAQGCGQHIEYECTTRSDCCAFTLPGVRLGKAPPVVLESEDPPIDAKGSLSKAHIRKVIDASIGEVRACFEAALKPKWEPNPAGIVTVQFVIAPEGHVQAAALVSSSLGIPSVEQCIVEATKRRQFAKPEGGGIVVVTYPFRLLNVPPGPSLECP